MTQTTIRNKDSIEFYMKPLSLDNRFSVDSIELYDVDYKFINSLLGIEDSLGQFISAHIRFNDITLRVIELCLIKGKVYINKNDFIYIYKLQESLYLKIESKMIQDRIENSVNDICSIKFIGNDEGEYKDRTYKSKNVPFTLKYIILEEARFLPKIYSYGKLNQFIKLDDFDLSLLEEYGAVLIFHSNPVDEFLKLNQQRLIYISAKGEVISSEIRSEWYSDEVDDFD